MWAIPGQMTWTVHIAGQNARSFSTIRSQGRSLYSESCLIGHQQDALYFSWDRVYSEGANIKTKFKMQILKL